MSKFTLLIFIACTGCSIGQSSPTCYSPAYYPFRLGVEADDQSIDSVFAAAGFDLPPLAGSDRAARLWTDDGLSVARVIEVRESGESCTALFHYRGVEYDGRGGEVSVDESVPFPDYTGCRALFDSLVGTDSLESRPRRPSDPSLMHQSIAIHKLELEIMGSNREFTFWSLPGVTLETIAPYEAILTAFEHADLGPVTVTPGD